MFKPGIVVFVMVIFMQTPQKTMHDVFMTEPSHEFHEAKSKQENE
jgi:hypothetical protein